MISTVVSNFAPENWDEWISQNQLEAGITQSLYWATIKPLLDGSKVKFITVDLGDRRVCQALFVGNIIRKGPIEITVMDCMGGPMIVENCDHQEILGALLQQVKKLKSTFGLQSISFSGFAPTSNLANSDSILSIFKDFGYNSKKWGTYLIDLTGAEEDVFGKVSSKCRSKVRKAIRQSVSVKQCDEIISYRKHVIPIYEETEIKQVHSLEWDKIRIEHDVKKRYHYFVAYSEDQIPLGTVCVCLYNEVAVRMGSALTQYSRKMKIPAQDILTWHSIKYARDHGANFFDMAGVNPSPSSEKEVGIRSFKSKWGGEYVEYNLFSKEGRLLKLFKTIHKILTPT